jgi:hypothetical protein
MACGETSGARWPPDSPGGQQRPAADLRVLHPQPPFPAPAQHPADELHACQRKPGRTRLYLSDAVRGTASVVADWADRHNDSTPAAPRGPPWRGVQSLLQPAGTPSPAPPAAAGAGKGFSVFPTRVVLTGSWQDCSM